VVKAQVEYPRPSNGDASVSMPPHVVDGQDLEDVAAYVGKWAGVPGAAPPKVPGGPGAQVFANNGCGGCHTLAAAKSGGQVGPNLDEVLSGQSAAMIEESIVDPNAKIATGYPENVMAQNFGETLSPEELENLVQYLSEETGGEGGAAPKGRSGGGATKAKAAGSKSKGG
jgi:mono/diheme cytochrome c family protein